MLRRHPSGLELGAWFDGEGGDWAGGHITSCRRCQHEVSEFGRVRAWIRAQPFVAMGDKPVPPSPPRGRGRLAVSAAVLLVFLLVASFAPSHGSRIDALGRLGQVARRGLEGTQPTVGPGGEGSRSAGDGAAEPAARRPLSRLDGGARPPAPVHQATAGQPLVLGLVVPTTGALAAEGTEVAEVARQRVTAANAAGGVGGNPVELLVVAAEDRAALASLPGRITALIGGFGAPPVPGLPWLMPADPSAAGADVVSVEASPGTVGAQLATVLRRQGLDGPIGVIVGPGPESALAAGLASKATVVAVAARPAPTCDADVAVLRRAGVAALALAGPPDLAARCVEAAARTAWRPRHGVLLAPSAAYAGVERTLGALGARTVLSLPWPTSPAAGAERFRSVTTGSTSYRALVSFAAVELAVDVARQQGALSLGAIGAGEWHTDLVDLVGSTARAGAVVAASPFGWLPVAP